MNTVPPSNTKLIIGYGAVLGVAVALFFVIRWAGERLPVPILEPGSTAAVAAAHPAVNNLLHVLLAIAVIILVTRTMGILIGRLGQPLVIGEVIGGILLGPSLLGHIAPDVASYLLPTSVVPLLNIIAQLGMILYMFLIGLELDPGIIRRSGQSTIAISHASITLPFILGSLLALGLYERMGTGGSSFTVFALFMGVSMSVTAFPVLARILSDRGVHKTRLGTIALTCAAVDDATAWCLLALVVSIAQANPSQAAATIAMTVCFVFLLFYVGRPLIRRWLPLIENGSENGLAVVFIAMLLSAVATEYIGIHSIFGAFVLGLVIPHDSPIAVQLTKRLEAVIAVLFLPAFFAFTGMRTQIGLISGWDNWLLCAIIIFAACVGKFGGTYAAARLTGMGQRDASALGILMNTRGLVELIVLNIGLDLGLLSPTLFAMLVIMALVTTIMTTPILSAIMRSHAWDELPDHAAQLTAPTTNR